ncbi:MAG: hypothetical protein GPOALKHO_001591 [Sodalis sp.]|nr:MAG: hypothetical protein GPOALKHO_001591 [Sodalis sp.]
MIDPDMIGLIYRPVMWLSACCVSAASPISRGTLDYPVLGRLWPQ